MVHKGRAPLKLALPRLGPLWPRPLQQGASDAERPLALVDRPAASRVPASPEPFADSETPVIWLRVHRF